jgi:hypothetical protein
MSFADHYFSKQKNFKACPVGDPSGQLYFSVVIPACREPEILKTLESLFACDRPAAHAEIWVVLNLPDNAGPDDRAETQRSSHEISAWIDQHSTPGFRFILSEFLDMPQKDAGVGLARKTGMDQALYRFNQLNRPEGLMLAFDADSTCERNYFTAIEKTCLRHPRMNGCNVYFEHPLEGPGLPGINYAGIVLYELHLRYLNLFTKYTGFPHAYHTIGSCFGVRAEAYARQGGMNRRKAGEDFYFLHKIIPLGHFVEINDTCIYPSPRESDRVPFGTGAAMRKYVSGPENRITTYAPACFEELRTFFEKVPSLRQGNTGHILSTLPETLGMYLEDINALPAIEEVRVNSSSESAFVKRIYGWFDAFRVIKFLNFASLDAYPKWPVEEAVKYYLSHVKGIDSNNYSPKELLTVVRRIEREDL